MALHPHPIPPVPAETARVARAAFPAGTPSLRMRDDRGPSFADGDFADLFPTRGQPAEAPWRLALVTIFQYITSGASFKWQQLSTSVHPAPDTHLQAI